MKKILFLFLYFFLFTFIFSKPPVIDDLVKTAQDNNPEIQEYYNKWQSALKRADTYGYLPDPQIKFSYFVKSIETRVGPQLGSFGVSQTIPWFGKLKLKKNIYLKDANVYYERYLEKKLEITLKVKKVFFKYYLKKQTLNIINNNILLLTELENIMHKKYKTGKSKYIDLVKLQIELDILKSRHKSIAGLLIPIKDELSTILNINLKEMLLPDKIQDQLSDYNENVLKDLMKKNKPLLKGLRELLSKKKAKIKFEKKTDKPDFSIGFNYILTKKSLMPDIIDNGKDPFAIMFSMKLPVSKKRNISKIKEAEFSYRANKYQMENIKNILETKLKRIIFNIKDVNWNIALYKKKIIPNLKKLIIVERKAFESGKGSFSNLIDLNRMILKYQLLLEKFIIKKAENNAELEMLIGGSLNRGGK